MSGKGIDVNLLEDLVVRAQAGDLDAFGRLVQHRASVKSTGGDPRIHTAIGVGYGLERFAMVRYGIDDIRKIDVARVA